MNLSARLARLETASRGHCLIVVDRPTAIEDDPTALAAWDAANIPPDLPDSTLVVIIRKFADPPTIPGDEPVTYQPPHPAGTPPPSG